MPSVKIVEHLHRKVSFNIQGQPLDITIPAKSGYLFLDLIKKQSYNIYFCEHHPRFDYNNSRWIPDNGDINAFDCVAVVNVELEDVNSYDELDLMLEHVQFYEKSS